VERDRTHVLPQGFRATIAAMARIAFIGTGGTFSNEGTAPTDYLSYLHSGKVLPAPEVLRLMPEVSEWATIIPVGFAALRSKGIGPAQWIGLARRVNEVAADPEIDGVIISHGTGVLEETAYFLHLTVRAAVPIVLVGAQRPPTTIGSDAQKNFLDAVHWIRAHPRRRGEEQADASGAVVVMNQQVHGARDVAKLANHTLSAMESPAAGPLARVNVDGSVTVYRRPVRRHTITSEFAAQEAAARREGGEGLPRVDVVHQYAGADAAALDAHVAAGAQGLVVVGFPPGTNTPAIEEAITKHAQAGVTIVQASRAIRDPQILPRVDLAGRVLNTDLSPQHARILLMLALAEGYRGGEVQRVFEEY